LHANSCTVNVALDLAVEIDVVRRAAGYRVVQGSTLLESDDVAGVVADAQASLVGLILRHFDAPPVEISVRSASPLGGGLGASSALAVALIASIERLTGLSPSSAEERSALARDIEAQLMGLPTGRQDHFPALLGGVLKIEFPPGGERVSRIDTDLGSLARSLIVAYTGQRHFSAGSNWDVIRRRLDREPETVRRFNGIAGIAHEIAEALEGGDLRTVGTLMSDEWELRRGLGPGVATVRIEELLRVAQDAGAWGGKVCGAGGGGCLAILAPVSARAKVEQELSQRGAQLLDTGPVGKPLEIAVS
jgi:D-glycero-alpha-D-manno-heptose-7-phosphate kinase